MPLTLFEKALHSRRALRKSTDAFRLFNGQGDGIPGLVADCFNRHFLIQIYSQAAIASVPAMAEFIRSHFPVDYMAVKNRMLPAKACQDSVKVLENKGSSVTVVTENGFRFQVDLNDAVNPGLFLDMRANRLHVGRQVQLATVLNCFAYTCSFGVYCQGLGAQRVVNVDISKKILEKGRENYRLNGLTVADKDFVYSDCMKFMKGAAKWGNCFDVIILDPPSFSRFEDKTFSVKKNMIALIALALAILNPKGRLLVSTNYSGIETQELEQWVTNCSLRCNRAVSACHPLGQDHDFPHAGKMKESHLSAVWAQIK